MDQAVLQKWDYCVEETNGVDALRLMLSRMGEQGWELVNVAHGNGVEPVGPVKTLRVRKGEAFCAIFKRARY